MANEFLTVKQAQYLLEKWKADAVQKSGDTMTGRLILSGGLSVTNAIHNTDPPYYLGLNEAFTDGGRVSWSSRSDVRAAFGIDDEAHWSNGSSHSVASGTDHTICNTGSLSAGTYLIIPNAQFAANSSGRRVLFLATSNSGSNISRNSKIQCAPAPGSTTELIFPYLTSITSSTTYYIRAYQNSGGNLNINGGVVWVKLHS